MPPLIQQHRADVTKTLALLTSGLIPVVGWLFAAAIISAATATPASAQPGAGPIQQGADVVLNDGVPKAVEGLEVEQKLGNHIPIDLPLIDSLGRKVQMSRYIDGDLPLVFTLNYSNCPMLCNIQLNQLAQSLEKMSLKIGEDYRLLSVSIDPTETDQRLRDTKTRYVEQVPSHPKADEGWAFCRTSESVIKKLSDEVGFAYSYNPATKQYSHPAMLVFVSPSGVITRYSLGVAFPADDMKLAIVEAGQGNVGSLVDQFVLWCSVYDSDANSYVPQAWKLMRLGGAVSIGILLVCLIPYWRGRKGTPGLSPIDAGVDPPPGDSPLKPTQWHLS